MKKRFIGICVCLCAFAIMIAVANSAAAAETSGTWGDNLTWEFHADAGKLTISGTGEMKSARNALEYPWSVHLEAVKTLVIAEGITSVGSNAFAYYSALESVMLPSTLTTIEAYAFYQIPIPHIDLPMGLTFIDFSAFSRSGLQSVTLPASLTYLGEYAFMECAQLKTVNIETAWVT